LQNSKDKNIVIGGAYGFGNIGDEAILESIIASLRVSYPDCKVTVLTRKPNIDINIKGVDATVHSLNVFAVIKALKKATLFVSGGGSLIQDVTSTRSLYYYLYILKLAKRLGCKVMMYGSGIGPVKEEKNRELTTKILNNCVDFISLRDEKSGDELESLKVTRPEILVAADPAICLASEQEEKVIEKLKSVGITDEDYYVIAIRNWNDFDSKADAFANAADYIFEKYGIVPLFLPINHTGDKEVADKVAALMTKTKPILMEALPARMALGIMKKAKAVLSIRLHGLIFAAAVGTPMAAISYDPKVSSFMKYLGVDNCIEFKDVCFDNLKKIIDKSLEFNRNEIEDKVQRLQNLEKRNITKIEELLDGNADGRIHLAFFESDFRVGGIQKALLRLLSNLDYNKYSADVYYYDSEFFYDVPKNENLRFIELKPYPYWCRFVFFDLLKIFTKQNFLNKEYDIAIDYNSYQNDCAVGATTIRAKKRIMWIHNDVAIKLKNEPKYRVLKFFFNGKYKYYDEFVAVSEGVIESFRKETKTTKPIYAIQNYINTEEIISMSQEEPAVDVSFDGYKLCSVGRLCHQKGFDILLDIFAKLVSQRKDIMLYLIGDGPDREKLEKQVKTLGIEKHVVFTDNQANPFAIMNQMDGFVLTSRYEGQGMVILEAKTLGLEIFISKNLEKYNPGIEGKDDLVLALTNAVKKEKQIDMLYEYNNTITRSLEELFKV